MSTDLEERYRPPKECEPAIRAKSEELLPVIREAARPCGYAIGQHGSMVRDIDLIAAPWVAEAAEPIDLIKAIVTGLKAHFGDDGVYWQAADAWEKKPHGRAGVTIFFQGRHGVRTPAGAFPFIDLSIMPRALNTEAAP